MLFTLSIWPDCTLLPAPQESRILTSGTDMTQRQEHFSRVVLGFHETRAHLSSYQPFHCPHILVNKQSKVTRWPTGSSLASP